MIRIYDIKFYLFILVIKCLSLCFLLNLLTFRFLYLLLYLSIRPFGHRFFQTSLKFTSRFDERT